MAEEHRSPQNIILENRKRLMLTGVREVDGFDEETVVLATELGSLTVRGSGLHIQQFDAQTGELSMEGDVCALVYTCDQKRTRGFFRRLLQ